MPSSYCGLLLVLLALFQDMAVSAPNPDHRKWEDIKDHAEKLNELAMKFYNHTQANDIRFENPKIQCEHQCGPRDLSLNKTTCLQHIHYVLSYYKMALENLTEDNLKKYEDANDIISIKNVISHLLLRLQDYNSKPVEKINATTTFVERRFGTPLASSSSVIARVFAAGNPENHWSMKNQ